MRTHGTTTQGVVRIWYGQGHPGGGREDLALLDRREKVRAARIAHPDERSWFAAARAGIRRVLAGHLDTDPARLGLAWAPDSDFRVAELPARVTGSGAPMVLATAHHGHRWTLALAPYGPLTLAMADPCGCGHGDPGCTARKVARARVAHLRGATALTVDDLPPHGPVEVALARPTALEAVYGPEGGR
ncbi:hypothetical protein ABT160_20110 [Streptomyces sp. NPDC001941]|uniref:hypothetical protein n=1 Tax=Streptomyces sp. NPDC001941 TaxID=3154659 RepID=UPI003322262C